MKEKWKFATLILFAIGMFLFMFFSIQPLIEKIGDVYVFFAIFFVSSMTIINIRKHLKKEDDDFAKLKDDVGEGIIFILDIFLCYSAIMTILIALFILRKIFRSYGLTFIEFLIISLPFVYVLIFLIFFLGIKFFKPKRYMK